MLRTKTILSRFALFSADAPLELLRTSSTTIVLWRVVASSEALAKVQHPDPDLLPCRDSREAGSGSTGGSTATELLSRVLRADSRHHAAASRRWREENCRCCEEAQSHDRRNLFQFRIRSRASSTLGALAAGILKLWRKFRSPCWEADSSGWQKANSPDINNLKPLSLAEIAG